MPYEVDRRVAAARTLATRCPPELGPEIAITGSVSKGLADDDSDVELNFWVEGAVHPAAIHAWLRSLGISEPIPDPGAAAESTTWLGFEWQGFWFEAGWQSCDEAEGTIGRLLKAETLQHDAMMLAETVANSLVLSTAGRLPRWRQMLGSYPVQLGAALIAQQLAFWSYPHWMRARYVEGRRGQWLAHFRHLRDDLTGCLRIVCALNRTWEPDWKWVDELLPGLALQPARFAERIGEAMLDPRPAQRTNLTLRLVLDTIALLPPSAEVEQARAVVGAALAMGAGLASSHD
jgi:hypothetical protein